MRSLEKETVMALHRLLTDTVGGAHGLRDGGLLDSAVLAAYATFDGVELYPTVEEKAARLAYSLIANHAFLDGNKRIGILAMLTLLAANGRTLSPTDEELTALGLGVAAGRLGYGDILGFIRMHAAKDE